MIQYFEGILLVQVNFCFGGGLKKKIIRIMIGVLPKFSCRGLFKKADILTFPCLYIFPLTFKGRMLHICRAACIPWWPNVTYK